MTEERFTISGSQVVEKIKQLIHEGNIRRVRVIHKGNTILEIPLTVARAALLRDATVAPVGPPVCDAIAIAKRDLRAGQTLDGLGGFTCYTLIENYPTARRADALPMGVSEGCVLKHAVAKDTAVTYADVELPPGRLCDRLRDEQDKRFAAAIAA